MMGSVVRYLLNGAVLLVVLMSGANAGAAEKEKPQTPVVLKGGKLIDVAGAKALADGKSALFFDMRSAVNFGKGHIPGATPLPYKEKSDFSADFDASMDTFDLAKLPADKKTKMVFYSDGPTGWKSYKAAVLTIKAGYKNVMWFREGFASWQAVKYPVE